jgi:hypothetical protein
MISELPGYAFAMEHGYTVYAYASDGHSVHYDKDGIELVIKKVKDRPDEYVATLYYYMGLIECKISEFSFPHKNFNIFEKQIFRLKELTAPMREGEHW